MKTTIPQKRKTKGAVKEPGKKKTQKPGKKRPKKIPRRAKKEGKKKLVIIAAAVLVLILGGGGAYFAGPFDFSPGTKGPTRIAVIDLGESVMHEFPQIKADLKTGKCRSPLLRTTFILQMKSTDLKRVQAMELRITDAIRSYLRDRERSDLVGRKGGERMRFETTQIINDLIAPSKIQGILFKEFVLQ